MVRSRTLLSAGLVAVLTAATLVGIVVARGAPSAQAATVGGTGTGYWSAQGNQLVDATGKPVRMTGINWFGMETANYTFHGLWSRPWKSVVDQVAELGYNTLRIPFSNEALRASKTTGIDAWPNPDLQGDSPLQVLDKVIDYAGTKGIRVLLDRHRPDAAQQSPLWYTAAVPESTWISDWQMLAKRYKGNTTVIGADLHNEPHAMENSTGACWGCDVKERDWRLAAERAGNAILQTNPDWLIVVEGVSCPSGNAVQPWQPPTGEVCGWWGGNLTKAKEFPVRLSNPKKLVYSPHEYATSVFEQEWFKAPEYPSNMKALWDSFWGYLHTEKIAPIVVGEFGTTLKDPRDAVWLKELMKYIGTGVTGMSFTYWALNPNSGDTGGILNDDWETVNATKQAIIEPYLMPPGSDPATTGSSSSPPSSSSDTSTSSGTSSSSSTSSSGTSSSGTSSSGTSSSSSSGGTGTCRAAFHVDNAWSGGFVASVTMTNTGTAAVSPWTATWTMPAGATVTGGWNATVSQTGSLVTATAPAWSTALAAGASVTIGFQASGSATPSPSGFALNGAACG